jgi:hypothetical protein
MNPRRAVFVLTAASSWLASATVNAQADLCSQAYEKSQEDRAAGRLNAAIAQLKVCIDASCPAFIREDCSRWMNETEVALPSVVFAVRRDGQDQMEAEVRCDGAVLVQDLDGKAIPVDPGPHTFTFSIPGLAPIERQLLVREGERNRVVEVDFRTLRTNPFLVADKNEPASTAAPSWTSRTYLTYGLGGVGALGIGSFALFAVLGSRQQADLEHDCAPTCRSSQVDSVKTKYLIADLSLGMGLAALGAATYLYVTNRNRKSPSRESTPLVGFAPRPGPGGVLELATPF